MQMCPFCDEPIAGQDRLFTHLLPVSHFECGMRALLGGVNHLRRRCSCFGGTAPPDEPGLSPREAAWAALAEIEASAARKGHPVLRELITRTPLDPDLRRFVGPPIAGSREPALPVVGRIFGDMTVEFDILEDDGEADVNPSNF
jgi:hypothetical protein